MQIKPYSLFFPLALLSLGFFFVSSVSWCANAFALAAIAGFFWSVMPKLSETEFPEVLQHLPIITLFLCLFGLIEFRTKPVSETMFFTVSMLICFRTLMFSLKTFRYSTLAPERGAILLMIGLMIELLASMLQVYSTLRDPLLPPNLLLRFSGWVPFRISGMFFILGWFQIQKRIPWMLLPAFVLFFIPLAVLPSVYFMFALGAGLIGECAYYFKRA